MLCRPDGLPREEDIVVDKLALKVEEEPAVAEIEVCVVSALVHHVIHLRVEYLDERAVSDRERERSQLKCISSLELRYTYRMLAKCASIARPLGKLSSMRSMRLRKQL